MRTYRELTRKILNEDLGQIFFEQSFYINDQEIGIQMYDDMLHTDMEGKRDFVVIAEAKQEHILGNKAYLVQNLIQRKFFEFGNLLDFVDFET
jgi:hypothetical protein